MQSRTERRALRTWCTLLVTIVTLQAVPPVAAPTPTQTPHTTTATSPVVPHGSAPPIVPLVTYIWANADGGLWNEPTNWLPEGVPNTAIDLTIFSIDGSYRVDATDPNLEIVAGLVLARGDIALTTHANMRGTLLIGTSAREARVVFTGGLDAINTHTIGEDGTLILGHDSILYSRTTAGQGTLVRAGGVLRGHRCRIEGHVLRNDGLISPGLEPGTIGQITLGTREPAGYIQTETGVLAIDIAGNEPGVSHDALRIVSAEQPVELAGTLTVSFLSSLAPLVGETFEVVTAPEITGEFDTVELPNLTGASVEVVYETQSVSIVVRALESEERAVALDLAPGACDHVVPYPLRVPLVAVIPGSSLLDAHAIDLNSLAVEGVQVLDARTLDEVAGHGGNPCECSTLASDGFPDVHFTVVPEKLMAALGQVSREQQIELTLTGRFKDGETFVARDCVLFRRPTSSLSADADRVAIEVAPQLGADDSVREISYNVPRPGPVRLSVYNTLGRQVARLVHLDQATGVYTVDWRTAGMPAGVYIVQVQVGGDARSAKALVLR